MDFDDVTYAGPPIDDPDLLGESPIELAGMRAPDHRDHSDRSIVIT
jgi:hypothetical protein